MWDEINRVILNFRAKSATTKYTSGHALQPSDVIRLADEITAVVERLNASGDTPREL